MQVSLSPLHSCVVQGSNKVNMTVLVHACFHTLEHKCYNDMGLFIQLKSGHIISFIKTLTI